MEKSAAVIFVVLLHLVFGFVLMTREQPAPHGIADAERTRLRFLERPTAAPAIVARTSTPDSSTAARVALLESVKRQMGTRKAEGAPLPLPKNSVTESALRLSLPDHRFSLAEKNPIVRTDQDGFHRESTFHVPMADSSLFGRYQQLLKSQDCAELRRALQRDSSSANAILATMSRRGCRI
ncbi:MAG: hypothetical protein QM795_18170 [Pseudoxanthomonas sp.]